MRKDALEIIRAVRAEPGWRYVSIITNGWFLTEDRAQKLMDTGIDQINVSLNFPDERQDTDRKLPGLFKKISHIVPWMTARGATVQLNSIIMNDNLEDVVPIAHLAALVGRVGDVHALLRAARRQPRPPVPARSPGQAVRGARRAVARSSAARPASSPTRSGTST